MSKEHRRGIIWALGSALSIAAFVIPWKLASVHGSASTNALILLSAAAIFNTLLTALLRRSVPRFSRVDLNVALVLAALTLLGNLASAGAIKLLSPALLTVVQRGEVIFVALLAWPIIGERVDRRFWVGAALAGVGLLMLQDPFAAGEPRAAGMALAAVSALCFGSMVVVTRLAIARIDPVSVNALRLWLSVALWFGLHGLPSELFEISAEQVGYAGLAAIFGPFLGRLCMMNSSKYVEARITTLATLAAPPITLLLGYVILSDLPSAREMLGGAVMLVGIAIPILGWARPQVAMAPSSRPSPEEIIRPGRDSSA